MTTVDETDIQNFVSQSLLNGRTIAADEDLLLSGLLDSLGVMTLVAHLEQQLDSVIPAQDITMENFTSVKTISNYLASR